METQKAQQGTWTLTAPDGRTWTGKSPINCASKELHERVSPEVRRQRIINALEVPLPADLPPREHLIKALEIIAGLRQCVDTLMGNKDIAIWALKREGRL